MEYTGIERESFVLTLRMLYIKDGNDRIRKHEEVGIDVSEKKRILK